MIWLLLYSLFHIINYCYYIACSPNIIGLYIVTCMVGVHATKITDSISDDWIY
jgi:hypothetical protein